MAPPIQITEKKLILTEGRDTYYFCIWAYQAFNTTGIQVLDFGGIKDLNIYLKNLTLLSGYENIETIVIVRDAEIDSRAAVNSITSALKNANLSVPGKPCEFAGNAPKVAYVVFPGFTEDAEGNQSLLDGTLEDLCLELVKEDEIFECVNQYIQCLESKRQDVRRLHKTKLHTYLAGKNNFVGLKIGEAARVGAWDWNHVKLEPFKQVILGM
ncbi:MAG: DUF3226 domain-containing protein [Deltaproteobacteria bacterium]